MLQGVFYDKEVSLYFSFTLYIMGCSRWNSCTSIHSFCFFLPVLISSIFLGWQKKIKVKHNDSGIQKHTFVGYSWTYFFFGFFVPIFRGEIAVAFLHFIFSLMTFGIFQLIMTFLYNKQYSTRLLNDSWSLDDSDENNQIARQKIGIAVNKLCLKNQI